MHRIISFLINLTFLLAGLWSSYGFQLWSQEPTPAPATSFEAKLASLTSRSALVFVGQVISTERRGGVVTVTFRVDQTVAGEAGGTYTLREWAGLWPQGQIRYAVGDRALVFLHGASGAGFSSPVDGAEGFVPVVVQGADAPALLDTRRLASALQRSPGMPLATPGGGTMLLSSAITAVQSEVIQEAALSHRRLKAPLRLPVGTGLSGQTDNSPFNASGRRPALNPEPMPILHPGLGTVAPRVVVSGVTHEIR